MSKSLTGNCWRMKWSKISGRYASQPPAADLRGMCCDDGSSNPPRRTGLLVLISVTLSSLTFCQLTNAETAKISPPAHHWSSFANGGEWQTGLSVNDNSFPNVLWSQEVKEGRSQVVADEKRVYVFGGGVVDSESQPRRLASWISAIDKADGRTIWTLALYSRMLENQETFSGAKPCPRATPLLHNGRLFAVTFTGQLICLSTRDGQLNWKIDLVADQGAIPVQFGFTSSVVVDPQHKDRICVLAAGESSGFYCLSVANGKVLWKADCKTASYATPVLANFGSTPQWVVVTGDEVMGLSASDGRLLWRHAMPEPGLTNVPTPLIVNDERMIVSGQGWQGTAAIKVTQANGRWTTDTLWKTEKLQYFYTNWIRLTDRVGLGCTDRYMAAFDLETGELRGRWRGFSDGNIVACNDGRYLVLSGNGKLNVLKFSDVNKSPKLSVLNQFQLIKRRCWTPLSTSSNTLFARHDDQLICFTFESGESNALQPIAEGPRELLMSQPQIAAANTSQDPVELIFEIFETKGPDAAFRLYSELRADGKLSEEDRIAIVEAARQTNQNEIANLILQHAMADFPDSVRIRALKQ